MKPILFEFGAFKLHSFGVLIIIAFISALAFARWRAARYGIDKEKLSDLSIVAIFAGIFGARIVYIAQEWSYYSKNTNELFSLQFNGLTSFGGLIFGGLAVVIYAKIKKIPLLPLLDILGPAFMLGHIFGRFGCLLNGCCYGRPAGPNFHFGVHVGGAEGLFEPAQIYDSFFNLIGIGIILLMEKKSWKGGQIFSMFLILHGLARFVYEFWRAGFSSTYWGTLPITEAQAFALLLSAIGVVGWFVFGKPDGRSAELKLQGSNLEGPKS